MMTTLSACVGEPGYDEYCLIRARGEAVLVFLDGVEHEGVIRLDTVEGYIDECVKAPHGGYLCGADGELISRRVHGAVVVETVKMGGKV